MKSEKRFWAIVALVFVAILVWQIFAGIMPALQRGVAALTPFLIAFATAYLLRHPVIWLERLLVIISKRKTHKWQHAAACAMVLILFLGLAGLLVAVIVPNVINNITDLVIRLPEYINTFTAFLSQQIEALSQWLDIDVNSYVVSVLQSAAEKAKDSAEAFAGAFQLFSAATGIVSSTISFLFDAVIYIIATFCLLYDYNKIKRSVKRLLRVFVRDNAHYNNVCAVCHESDVIIEKYGKAFYLVGIRHCKLYWLFDFRAAVCHSFGHGDRHYKPGSLYRSHRGRRTADFDCADGWRYAPGNRDGGIYYHLSADRRQYFNAAAYR